MAVDPTTFATVNPLTLIYQTLLAAFKADAPLAAKAGVLGGTTGNMPDMTDPNFVAPLTSLNQSDTPYLLLQRTSLSLQFAKNSRAVGFTATHRLMVFASDLRTLDVDFVTFRAFVVLTKLQPAMNLQGLVEGIDAGSARDGPQDVLGGLRTVGILDIPVRGYIDRSYMLTA